MRDMVLIKGPESRLLWANQAFLDYYGMSRAELRDLIDGPQSDPDDTLQYVRDDALVFEVEDHVDVPAEAVTDHTGSVRLFQTIKSPMRVNGDVVMSVGVSRRHEDADVTLSPSHVEAKALSKPLRLLAGALQLPAIVLDVRGRVVAASQAWAELFGPPPTDSNAFFARAYPTLSMLEADAAAAVKSGDSSERSIRYGEDTGARDYAFKIGPWTYDDGSVGGALILGIDETERTAQARIIEEANDRFDLVLAGASVGVWDWIDVNEDQEYWSPRFYRLLGYEPGEIEATLSNFADLLHPDDAERTFALVDQHFANGTAFDIDYRLRTKDGDYRWFRGMGLAARDENGNPTRMVGSIQDIDERVQAQKDVERMNEDLEHFAHVASHDLREPARRQSLLIDFFVEDHQDSLTDRHLRELQAIKDQSTAMLEMINGFRLLTRLGGPDVQIESLDLQSMARSIVDESLPVADAKAAVVDLPEAVPGYRRLVDLLLRNLVLNAREHGSDPLSLKLHSANVNATTVFTVENSWNGEVDSITDNIFKPFVTGRQRDTTGIGLSICRRVVEHHRGWIRAVPEPGTFRVEFNLGAT